MRGADSAWIAAVGTALFWPGRLGGLADALPTDRGLLSRATWRFRGGGGTPGGAGAVVLDCSTESGAPAQSEEPFQE